MNKIVIDKKGGKPKPKAGQIWKCFFGDEAAIVMIAHEEYPTLADNIYLVDLSNGRIWATYKSLEECIESSDIFIGENVEIVIKETK